MQELSDRESAIGGKESKLAAAQAELAQEKAALETQKARLEADRRALEQQQDALHSTQAEVRQDGDCVMPVTPLLRLLLPSDSKSSMSVLCVEKASILRMCRLYS